MRIQFLSIFIIISLMLVIPSSNAQEINVGEKAKQKLVEVVISESGDIHVKHIVDASNSPKQVELIDGTIENLTITDEEGEEQLVTVIGENDAVLIFPSSSDSIIEYDLKDVLFLKDDYWTWNFLYLESTTFIIPESLDLVFVNDRPVNLDDKRGFVCHGCQMKLEYSLDEPRKLEKVKWEDREFVVDIKTHSELNGFNFNQEEKSITLDVLDENKFVTIIIPLELLWEPYTVFINEDKIQFSQFLNNGTHVGMSMRPETAGEITIVGTTAVPEFPIIAPLAIGFLIILALPFVRKSSLH